MNTMNALDHDGHFYALYIDTPIRPLYSSYPDQPDIIDHALLHNRAWDIAIGASLPLDTSIVVNLPEGAQKTITVGALRDYLRSL